MVCMDAMKPGETDLTFHFALVSGFCAQAVLGGSSKLELNMELVEVLNHGT